MTVGKGLKVRAKTLQGQILTADVQPEWKVAEVKKILAKQLNDMAEVQKDTNTAKVHPAQVRLTHKENDLQDDQIVRDVDNIEEDFVFVFVGDASKVPINVKIHVFKGTGVDATNLDVNLGDTAATIKDKLVAASFGPQDKSYTLFFKGRPLLDKHTLMHYGIEEGSEILIGVIM